MFLMRKLSGQDQNELGSRHNTRIEGRCLKHHMGPATIKIYDEFGFILRIETASNDVSFSKHHRMVEHRNDEPTFQVVPARKHIYSLHVLMSLRGDANRRYLDFLSALDDRSVGVRQLHKVCAPKKVEGRTYPGFNFFSEADLRRIDALARGSGRRRLGRTDGIHEKMP